ncbi:MAG TPA: hypothetical protein VFE33_21140 [Thermoanaerobaculia bacterium]|nr:hypothetical protein [Thermoanaerobaculia bacterium]
MNVAVALPNDAFLADPPPPPDPDQNPDTNQGPKGDRNDQVKKPPER